MNYKRIGVFIREQYRKVATFFKSRDVVTFLLFLLLASFLWLMHSTSSKREMRSTARIRYTGVPSEVIFEQGLPEKIEFMVRDDDRQMWSYLSFSSDTLVVDLSGSFAPGVNELEIEYEQYLHRMVSKFSPTSKIIDLSPSIFSTKFTRLAKKEVSVVLSGSVNISPQHVLTDEISIVPDVVTIIGPEGLIDSVTEVRTEGITEMVTKSKSIRCGLLLPKGVKSETESVSVVVPIEASTEKRMVLPIKAINVPAGMGLRTFPNEAEVVFNIGLSRYNDVTADDIDVVVDYNDIKQGENGALNLKVNRVPESVKKLRFSPRAVEYIIEGE